MSPCDRSDGRDRSDWRNRCQRRCVWLSFHLERAIGTTGSIGSIGAITAIQAIGEPPSVFSRLAVCSALLSGFCRFPGTVLAVAGPVAQQWASLPPVFASLGLVRVRVSLWFPFRGRSISRCASLKSTPVCRLFAKTAIAAVAESEPRHRTKKWPSTWSCFSACVLFKSCLAVFLVLFEPFSAMLCHHH